MDQESRQTDVPSDPAESIQREALDRPRLQESVHEDREQAEDDLQLSEKRQQAMLNLVTSLAGQMSLEEACHLCLKTAIEISGMDSGGIYVMDSRQDLHLIASIGLSKLFVEHASLYISGSPNCKLVMAGKPIYIGFRDLGFPDENWRAVEGLKGLAGIPMLHSGRAIACFNIASHELEDVPVSARVILETLAALVSSVIARIRTEESLHASERRFRSLIENSGEALTLLNAQGEFVYASPSVSRINGYPPAAYQGQDALAIFHPEDLPKARELIRQIVHEPEATRPFQCRIHRADGSWRWIEGLVTNRLADTAVGALVVNYRDITDRRRADDKLKRAHEALKQRNAQLKILTSELTLAEQRERRRLAAVLHDDLQQLLVGATLQLASMQRCQDMHVRQAAGRVAELIQESIAVSRSLTAELSPPILHREGLIPALQWLATWIGDKHGMAVVLEAGKDVDVPGEDMVVLLFQAVRELLFNAVKHAKVRSSRVEVVRDKNYIQVTVSDKGVGFSPKRMKTQSLTGCGLFSLRERLKVLGGSMEIDSKPGKGSRFVLRAPLRPPTDTSSPQSQGPRRQNTQASVATQVSQGRRTPQALNKNLKIRMLSGNAAARGKRLAKRGCVVTREGTTP